MTKRIEKIPTKLCNECGTEFQGRLRIQVFCCPRCKQDYFNAKRRGVKRPKPRVKYGPRKPVVILKEVDGEVLIDKLIKSDWPAMGRELERD